MKVDIESGLSKLFTSAHRLFTEKNKYIIRGWQFVGVFGFVKFWQLEWFNQIVDFIAPIQVGISFLNRQYYSFELFTIV